MQIIYGSNEDWITEEWKLLTIDKNSDLFLKKILDNNSKEVRLNSVEIETINRCNNNCSFCPVSVGNEKRKLIRMDDNLFYKIIDDLAAMEYKGVISLFSNNEPLLDSRLIDFIKYAVKKLPYAKHALCTNGLLLDRDKYIQLIELLDYLIIDNYNDKFELNESVKNIMDISAVDSNCDVTISMRKKNQVLLSRGGNSPNKQNNIKYTSTCVLPFIQMIIRPDGKVSKCCQDAYGAFTLGDVSCNSVSDIWNSEVYNNFRRTMLKKGRNCIEGCSSCDLFGLNNYYEIQWKHQYINTLIETIFSKIYEGHKIALVGDYLKLGKYIDLFEFNGIKVDYILNDIKTVENNVFYVFTDYYWEQLSKFKNKIVGEDYIIIDRNDNFEISHKKVDSKDSIRISDILGKIIRNQIDNNLVIFGTGNNAQRLLDKFAFNPVFFIDNNPQKQKELFFGKNVYSIEKLTEKEYLILVSPENDIEIIEQIKKIGVLKENIIQAKYLLEDF